MASPSVTKGLYKYDFGDTAATTPLMKMYTLGHSFIPAPIHAGGLRYHGMAPLICHLYELGIMETRAEHQVPVFEAAPRRFDFGALPQGRASAIQTLTVSNSGAGWLDLKRIVVRGDHGEDFTLVAGTCDGVTALAPGGTCSVGLRFTPRAEGNRRGVVIIEHGASGSPTRIDLTGVGALP